MQGNVNDGWKNPPPYFSKNTQEVKFIADIDGLPEDLLVHIFQETIAIVRDENIGRNFGDVHHYSVIGALRLVSTHWNTALCSHPVFWTKLSLAQDEGGWDVVLKHNPEWFLDVRAWFTQGPPKPEISTREGVDYPSYYPRLTVMPKSTKFFELATKEMRRIRRLCVSYEGTQFAISDVVRLVCEPAPILEAAIIAYSLPFETLFGGHAPALRSLSILFDVRTVDSMPMRFLGGQLEHFKLINDEGLDGLCPAIDFLPHLLRHSPQLKSIELHHCGMTSPTHVASEDAIIMGQLHSITLHSCNDMLILFLFRDIITPVSTHLDVRIRWPTSLEARDIVERRLADNLLPRDGGDYHPSLCFEYGQLIRTPSNSVSSRYQGVPLPNSEFQLPDFFPDIEIEVLSALSSIYLGSGMAGKYLIQVLHKFAPHLKELGYESGGWDYHTKQLWLLEEDITILPSLQRVKLLGNPSWLDENIGLVVEAFACRWRKRSLESPRPTLVLGSDNFLGVMKRKMERESINLEVEPWLMSGRWEQ